jgi:hypothetical protein
MGGGLREIFGSLAGLFLLAGNVAVPPAAAAEDCTLKQLASLDMLDTATQMVVVPAMIGGNQVSMLVDTGGITSTIFFDTATALGLRPTGSPSGIIDAHGKVTTALVMVPQFGLGNMRGSDLWFMSMPRITNDAKIGAILAPDILRAYDVELDFANKKLKLFSPEHCAGRVVYWAADYNVIGASIGGGGHLEIPVVLDGHDLRAAVDTGAPVSTLSESHAYRLFNIDESSPGVELIPGIKPQALIRYRNRFKELSFGGVRVSNPLIALLPDTMEQKMRMEAGKLAHDPAHGPEIDVPAFLIGLDVPRKLHLYIAYREQKVYLTAANAGAVTGSSGATAANRN